jgi:hypothetical protein
MEITKENINSIIEQYRKGVVLKSSSIEGLISGLIPRVEKKHNSPHMSYGEQKALITSDILDILIKMLLEYNKIEI